MLRVYLSLHKLEIFPGVFFYFFVFFFPLLEAGQNERTNMGCLMSNGSNHDCIFKGVCYFFVMFSYVFLCSGRLMFLDPIGASNDDMIDDSWSKRSRNREEFNLWDMRLRDTWSTSALVEKSYLISRRMRFGWSFIGLFLSCFAQCSSLAKGFFPTFFLLMPYSRQRSCYMFLLIICF